MLGSNDRLVTDGREVENDVLLYDSYRRGIQWHSFRTIITLPPSLPPSLPLNPPLLSPSLSLPISVTFHCPTPSSSLPSPSLSSLFSPSPDLPVEAASGGQ